MAGANPDTASTEAFEKIEATSSIETAMPMQERASLHTNHRVLLTIGVMMATIMQILDSTIANVALPHMAPDLGATTNTISWVLTSYIIASAIAIPITGWLADRIGSRNLFLYSAAGFILASVLCGLATNLSQMVGFRLLQGVSAAFMNPLSQTVLMDINPPSKQAKAMTIWGQGIMVGPILGPVIGGFLTDSYSWRWCFYVNLPFGLVCLGLLWWLLPSREIKKRELDVFGFSLLAVALCAFQLMLDRGQESDWFSSWEICLEALVAAGAFWMFLVQMFTGKRPLFSKDLLADRNLLTGVAFMLVTSAVMMSSTALLPGLLQQLFGYPVLTTGFLLITRGVGIILAMQVTSRLMERHVDMRLMIAIGFSVVGASLWWMTGWSPEMATGEFVWTGIVQGVGMGLAFSPMNIIAFSTLKPTQRTDGTSLMNLARNVGASVGISALTTLLARNIQINHEEIGARVPDVIGAVAADPLIASVAGSSSEQVLAMADGLVNQQAAMISYLNDFKLMMIAVFCVVPLVLLVKLRKHDPAEKKDDTVHVFE